MTQVDGQQLREALKLVAGLLKAADVPFALTGGYALWARGGPEPVHDVDFVVLERDVPRILDVLDDGRLRVVDPPEDWLIKVYLGDALVDLIFRPSERPVTMEQLHRADDLRVDSVLMPVESATDVLVSKALALSERFCDFGRLFPHARALREQIDWALLRHEVRWSPFARAFLTLCDELRISPDAAPDAADPAPGLGAAPFHPEAVS